MVVKVAVLLSVAEVGVTAVVFTMIAVLFVLPAVVMCLHQLQLCLLKVSRQLPADKKLPLTRSCI